MARQGCRNQRFLPHLSLAIAGAFAVTVASSALAFQADSSVQIAPANSAEVDYRLELTWNSTVARIWAGEVFVASRNQLAAVTGRLSEPGNLTPGMLMSGGIHVSPTAAVLRFAPPPTASYLRDRNGQFVSHHTIKGGVTFRVRGSENDRVVISLRRDGSNELMAPIAINLSDLSSGRSIETRLSDSTSWSLKRAVRDRLRVSLVPIENSGIDRTSLTAIQHEVANASVQNVGLGTSLFWDDQTAKIEISCNKLNSDSLELVCDTLSDGIRAIASQSWPITIVDGKGIIAENHWHPPAGDGGYELRWRLQHQSNPRTAWGVSIPGAIKDTITKPLTMIRGTSENPVLAESSMNVVVMSRHPALRQDALAVDSMTVVGRIEPFGKSWSVSRFNPVRQASQFVPIGSQPNEPKKSAFGETTIAELSPGSHWQHVLPVAKIGERHRITLTFPDAKAMRLGLSILDHSPQDGKQIIVRDVTCIRTRIKTSNSGWATAIIDFYPQSSSPQIVLVNRDSQQTAVFEAIEVGVAKSIDFPNTLATSKSISLPPGTGLHPLSRAALLHVDATTWLETFGDLMQSHHLQPVVQGNVFEAALRLVETIKRQGYTGVMMTVCQDGQSLYRSQLMTADRSNDQSVPMAENQSPETLEMLLRLFDRESLVFLPCVRANSPLTRLEEALIEGRPESRGIAPSNPWNGFDLALGDVESMDTCVYSVLHEMVTAACVDLLDELLQQTANHPCVSTIGVLADEGSCFRLPARFATMDNATLDRFHASLPDGKIARSQVVGWINEDGAAAFDKWRAERLFDMVRGWLKLLDASETSLIVATSCDQVPSELLELAAEPRLMFTRLHRRNQLQSLSERWRDEATSMLSYSSNESIADSTFRSAFYLTPEARIPCTDGDRELLRLAGKEPTDKIRSRVLLDPVSSSLSMAKLWSKRDRDVIIISGTEATQCSEVQRRSLATFRALPAVLMNDVTPSDEAMKLVKLRRVKYEGATYLMATNHCRWPMSIDVDLTNVARIENVVQGGTAPVVTSGNVWRATLLAGELVAVRIPAFDAKVRTWSAQPVGGAANLAEIGGMVRELADSIAANTEPQLSRCIENASFETELESPPVQSLSGTVVTETSGSVPVNVPGWLMAQHPVGCAVLDNDVAYEGKRSIRLSNRDGRPGGTWIVSRTIPNPASGRIAMSLKVRGEPSEDPSKSEPIVLRVAIEGVVAGSSMRQVISMKVARDGKWSTVPCRVEVASLPRCGIESLRLAVDVMNEGTVWIDDVKAEDAFLTAAEKTQMQSELFLALGGISKGDLSQAAKLLGSHWVQEMLGQPITSRRPVIVTSSETLDTAAPASDNGAAGEQTPSMAERLKAWLPRPIRF